MKSKRKRRTGRELTGLVPDDHARYWQITLDFLKIVQEAWPAHLAEQGKMDPKARRSALIRREAQRLAAAPAKRPCHRGRRNRLGAGNG
jgi:ATP-dependent helicase/nuclease subunit B